MSEHAWRRLSRAAGAALVAHLVAGLSMWFVLRHGLESERDLDARVAFLADHRLLWTAAWLPWALSALAMFWLCRCLRAAHGLGPLAERLVLVAVLLDLTAQGLEVVSVPALAAAGEVERFLEVHRSVVLLTGFGANGLYTAGVLLLAWRTRRSYPTWTALAALGIGVGGVWLSAAALVAAAGGMVASNALLVPALLVWLFGVGRHAGQHS